MLSPNKNIIDRNNMYMTAAEHLILQNQVILMERLEFGINGSCDLAKSLVEHKNVTKKRLKWATIIPEKRKNTSMEKDNTEQESKT